MADLDALKQELVETCAAIVRSGILSLSGHGNASLRVPGRDEMLLTSGGRLAGLTMADIAHLRLDGELLAGTLVPTAHEIVQMHALIYREREEIGCVIHTHAPYATAFAVAGRPILCWSEAAARFGLDEGAPVAAYGPRGSQESLDNIRRVLTPRSKAVLLANHGVLTFDRTAQGAIAVSIALEETAQLGLYAASIGGPRELPPELRAYTQERAQQFAAMGTISAWPADR